MDVDAKKKWVDWEDKVHITWVECGENASLLNSLIKFFWCDLNKLPRIDKTTVVVSSVGLLCFFVFFVVDLLVCSLNRPHKHN